MASIIKIRNLSFAYNEKKIFDKLTLDIEEGSWTTILGSNGSGKTTLGKLMLGLLPTNDYIVINNLLLNKQNIKEIRREVSQIFPDPEKQFIAETVNEDIIDTLENYGYSEEQIKNKIAQAKFLYGSNTDIFSKDFMSISNSDKQILGLITALILNLKVIILDEGFTMMDEETKEKAIALLKEFQQKDHLTVINITHNPDECLLGTKVIVLSDGKVICSDETTKILKDINLFTKLGLEPSFMAELSSKLQAYNLIDAIYLNEEELIEALWK
jgi:energy-coupling factor transport system ATP-binding protein